MSRSGAWALRIVVASRTRSKSLAVMVGCAVALVGYKKRPTPAVASVPTSALTFSELPRRGRTAKMSCE